MLLERRESPAAQCVYFLLSERLKEDLDFLDGKASSSTEPPVQREKLKARDYAVDLQSRLGKSQVITKTTPLAEQGKKERNGRLEDNILVYMFCMHLGGEGHFFMFPTSHRVLGFFDFG